MIISVPFNIADGEQLFISSISEVNKDEWKLFRSGKRSVIMLLKYMHIIFIRNLFHRSFILMILHFGKCLKQLKNNNQTLIILLDCK